MSEAGYSGPQTVTVPDKRIIARTSDDVVASVYSLSSSAPHLFGDRLADFQTELYALLEDASPTGRFSEQTGENMLRIWRPV